VIRSSIPLRRLGGRRALADAFASARPVQHDSSV